MNERRKKGKTSVRARKIGAPFSTFFSLNTSPNAPTPTAVKIFRLDASRSLGNKTQVRRQNLRLTQKIDEKERFLEKPRIFVEDFRAVASVCVKNGGFWRGRTANGVNLAVGPVALKRGREAASRMQAANEAKRNARAGTEPELRARSTIRKVKLLFENRVLIEFSKTIIFSLKISSVPDR